MDGSEEWDRGSNARKGSESSFASPILRPLRGKGLGAVPWEDFYLLKTTFRGLHGIP